MRIKTAEKTALILTACMLVATVAVALASGARNGDAMPVVSLHSPAQASTPPTEGQTNINTADAEALSALPGVGSAIAQRIIDYRETHGPFTSPGDIIDVAGIGLKTFEKLREQITV